MSKLGRFTMYAQSIQLKIGALLTKTNSMELRTTGEATNYVATW
jgi:hypothetical protein